MSARKEDGLLRALDEYAPQSDAEARDVERMRTLAAQGDAWDRSAPLHATGSAIVVHPDTARVLLRWHDRMQSWLQVGGHAEVGEGHPFDIAQREAREETGLPDLTSWPDPARAQLVHVVIVPVPAGRGEPAHEHADLRYLLATSRPAEAIPESASAAVRWFSLSEALVAVAHDNTRETIRRIATIFQRTENPPHSA
jgi:8-oxo-dGTP pyrophosphatase MutT (NUDIX family)